MKSNPNTILALERVKAERLRQKKLLSVGIFNVDVSNPNQPAGGKMMVLAEEFGEVAKAALAIYDPPNAQKGPSDGAYRELRDELIQVAAVAVAWVESIDSELNS